MTWAGFLLGGLAVAVGLLLCLRGAVVLRTFISVWAALVGFSVGAGSVAAVTGDGFLAGPAALIAALACAALFGVVAFSFYVVAIVIAMAAFGFALGTDVMVALGVSWSWLVVLAGVLAGAALGAVAVASDLPVVLLVVLSALSGSSVTLTGVLLVTGTIATSDLTDAATTSVLQDRWWWWAAYVALAVVGASVQLRLLTSWRAPVHSQWGDTHSTQGRAKAA